MTSEAARRLKVTKRKAARVRKTADPMTMMNLIVGKWVSQAISVAAEFGFADLLQNGTKSAAELARAADASEDGVYRLLRALAGIGLLVESRGRRFRLTPLGHLLRSDAPQSTRGFARFVGHESVWRPWGELRHSIRTGAPAFDRLFGMSVFEYLGDTPEAAAIFHSAMTSLSTMESKAVVAAYDFSGIGTLADIGGGQGLLVTTVLKANRKMKGILFDLPHATAGADALLQEQGVANRCQVVAGDFFGSVPDGADAYMMKHIIHDWDDERAIQILRGCHRAMRPGTRLLVIDVVIDSAGAGQYGHLLDLEMLALTPRGRERTKAEFRDLLTQAEFRFRRVVPTDGYLSIVEGTKA